MCHSLLVGTSVEHLLNICQNSSVGCYFKKIMNSYLNTFIFKSQSRKVESSLLRL